MTILLKKPCNPRPALCLGFRRRRRRNLQRSLAISWRLATSPSSLFVPFLNHQHQLPPICPLFFSLTQRLLGHDYQGHSLPITLVSLPLASLLLLSSIARLRSPSNSLPPLHASEPSHLSFFQNPIATLPFHLREPSIADSLTQLPQPTSVHLTTSSHECTSLSFYTQFPRNLVESVVVEPRACWLSTSWLRHSRLRR